MNIAQIEDKVRSYPTEPVEYMSYYQDRKIPYAHRKFEELKKLYQCDNR